MSSKRCSTEDELNVQLMNTSQQEVNLKTRSEEQLRFELHGTCETARIKIKTMSQMQSNSIIDICLIS